MGETIWAVSEGAYSDYGVVAVFASREAAEETVASNVAAGGDEMRVEEFEFRSKPIMYRPHFVVRSFLPPKEKGYRWETAGVVGSKSVSGPGGHAHHRGGKRPKVGIGPDWQGVPQLVSCGFDREGVVKAFSDRFAQWMVETDWPGMMPEIDWGDKPGEPYVSPTQAGLVEEEPFVDELREATTAYKADPTPETRARREAAIEALTGHRNEARSDREGPGTVSLDLGVSDV